MTKSTKDLNAEIAKLRAASRAAEKTEYETFGRWVVDQFAPAAKGAASERIDAARHRLGAVADVPPSTAPVGDEQAESVAHENGDAVDHSSEIPPASWP